MTTSYNYYSIYSAHKGTLEATNNYLINYKLGNTTAGINYYLTAIISIILYFTTRKYMINPSLSLCVVFNNSSTRPWEAGSWIGIVNKTMHVYII